MVSVAAAVGSPRWGRRERVRRARARALGGRAAQARSAGRTPFERDRARRGALGRAAPAGRQDAGRGAADRRLRPQPAHPHPRGRPGRPRPRAHARLRPRHRGDARPWPTTSGTRRSATTASVPSTSSARVLRRVRGQRPDAADPDPAGGQDASTTDGRSVGPEPHPGDPRRQPRSTPGPRADAEQPHGSHADGTPRAVRKFGVYDDDRRGVHLAARRTRPAPVAASRRR